MKTRIALLACILILSPAYARHRTAKSAREFYQYIQPRVENELTLTAVMFYNGHAYESVTDKKARSDVRKSIRDQERTFRDASKGFNEVDFISVDMASRDNDSLISAYQLDKHPYAQILLFKSGKAFKTKDGARPVLVGNLNQNNVLSVPRIAQFVKKYLNASIKAIVKAKAQARIEIEKAEARAPRVYAMGYPYWGGWGWGYPYYGWGYPYGRWGVGIGFGW